MVWGKLNITLQFEYLVGLSKAIYQTQLFMMPLRQQKLNELGCRLGYQAPRKDSTLGSRDKSVTVKNSKYPLSILQWNANDLGHSKLLELKKSLQDHNIQIASIQETLLKTKDVLVPGFTPYKCKCQEECQNCQGILTLIWNDVTAEVSEFHTNDRNDIQLVKIWRNGMRFSLYNIYSIALLMKFVMFDYKVQS